MLRPGGRHIHGRREVLERREAPKGAGRVLQRDGRIRKAVEAYKKAADFFAGEEQHTSANGVLLEVAKLYAEDLAMHAEAVENFERVAKSYIAHSSIKFQVKDLLLRSMLCRLAMVKANNRDEQASVCREAFAKYCDWDVHLQGTREAELLETVLTAIETEEPEAVSRAAAEYEGIKRLDDWQVQTPCGEEDAAGRRRRSLLTPLPRRPPPRRLRGRLPTPPRPTKSPRPAPAVAGQHSLGARRRARPPFRHPADLTHCG